MEVRIVACGIFQLELEQVLRQIGEQRQDGCLIEVTYVPPALHVDYDKLKGGITDALDQISEPKKILLFGSMCHPEIGEFTEKYQVVRLSPGIPMRLLKNLNLMASLYKGRAPQRGYRFKLCLPPHRQ
jgi:hypothetical protein